MIMRPGRSWRNTVHELSVFWAGGTVRRRCIGGPRGQKTRHKKRGFGFYASSCRWSVGEVVIRLR